MFTEPLWRAPSNIYRSSSCSPDFIKEVHPNQVPTLDQDQLRNIQRVDFDCTVASCTLSLDFQYSRYVLEPTAVQVLWSLSRSFQISGLRNMTKGSAPLTFLLFFPNLALMFTAICLDFFIQISKGSQKVGCIPPKQNRRRAQKVGKNSQKSNLD